MEIEGPVFPREGVRADYLGYWMNVPGGEGMLISAQTFCDELLDIYKRNF